LPDVRLNLLDAQSGAIVFLTELLRWWYKKQQCWYGFRSFSPPASQAQQREREGFFGEVADRFINQKWGAWGHVAPFTLPATWKDSILPRWKEKIQQFGLFKESHRNNHTDDVQNVVLYHPLLVVVFDHKCDNLHHVVVKMEFHIDTL